MGRGPVADECRNSSYSYETAKWTVVTLDGTQTKTSLPRIYVMFRAEDPKNFALRVLDAVQRRHQAEKLIKFHIYCDSMPLDGMPGLEESSIQRIYRSVTRRGFLKAMDDKIDRVRSVYIKHLGSESQQCPDQITTPLKNLETVTNR